MLRKDEIPKYYNMALDRAIECGELVLRAELSLSYHLKQIKTRQGMRTDLKKVKKQHKTKAKQIKEEYGLTPEQAKKISMLQEWAVEAAIKQGWKNREIPTRSMAIQMIKEKHKAENNKPYNPEAVYMDYVPYPEDIMQLPPIRSTTLCSNVGIDEYFLEYAHVKNVIAVECEKPSFPSQTIKHLQTVLNKQFDEKKIKDREIREAILKIVGILGNLSLFMQQSDNNAKNILLGLLLSDCILKDKRITYTINKPFSYLLACPDYKKWKGLIIKHLKDFKAMVLLIQKL